MLKAKLIEGGIRELGPIVTANSFQVVEILVQILHLCFQEENPRVTRIVINDDKNIPLATHGANTRGTDSVHME
jgi:hypothetical protein